MKLDFPKLQNKYRLQTAIIIAGSFILVAEIILLAIFLIIYFAGGNGSRGDSKDDSHKIVAPYVSTVKRSPFEPEDFVYDGAYMTCLSKPAQLGVDVSYYQGDIDWKQVKAAGFTFAIIRVGGRGYGEEGGLYADTHAQQNYEGAKAAGLKVGAYFFSQAITEDEAKEEAWYALDLISGWELDLPLVYDWEYISDDARTGGMEESDKICVTKAFFQVVETVGLTPMAYVMPWAGEDYMRAVQDYPVWVVQYSEPMDFPYNFSYWQYTCTGTVPGIEGEVDINLYIP